MGFLQIAGLGRVHYHEYGNGSDLLFAFHGYGMLGDQFKVLENSILQRYRVIGFDQFFHGETQIEDVKEAKIVAGMQPHLLAELICASLKQFGVNRFSLMGYSIGANMVLYLVQHFAAQVDSIYLMAPDGLVPHKGFSFLRASFIGKKLFRRLTYSSWMMPGALMLLKKIKVIDQSLFAIAYKESDTHEKRLTAYRTINFIRNIRPDIQQIAALINKNNISCMLYFGEFDYLFPQKNASLLISLLDKPQLYVMPSNHWLVTKELDDFMARQTA